MSCEDISNRTNTLRAEADQADEELSRMEDLLEELGEWLEENAENPDIEDDVYEEKSEQYYLMEEVVEDYFDEWNEREEVWETAFDEYEACMAEHKKDSDTLEFPHDVDIEEPESL